MACPSMIFVACGVLLLWQWLWLNRRRFPCYC